MIIQPGRFFWLSVLVGTLVGCAHTNVRTDFDSSADFSKYHTYYWAGGTDVSGGGSLSNSLVDRRIRDIVTAQLSAKGLREVLEGAEPDLAVLYWVGTKDKTSIETTSGSAAYQRATWSRYDPYWGARWGRTYDEVVVRNYTEGTLIVDLIDANAARLVWRAYLVQTIDKDPQKTAKRADANAKAAFAEYPPSKNSP